MERGAEARGLVPDQKVIAMNVCKHRSMDQRVCCGTHCDILQLPREFARGGEMSETGVHDLKFTKNQ